MMNKRQNMRAFTLIELLVVISIIAMLVGIMAVGMRKAKVMAKNLQQKAVFHAADVSLGLFNGDFEDYPDSAQVTASGESVTGAQRLAEVLFGRDDRGFHPKTRWHPGLDASGLYTDATIKNRKPAYLERKRGGFYTLNELWGATPGLASTPVFTDVFEHNSVVISGENEKVGMPILYFKASPTKNFRVNNAGNAVTVANADVAVYGNWVYNFEDNLPILQLPWLREIQDAAPTDGMALNYKDPQDAAKSNAQFFYEQITQREDGNYFTPYNKSTYILISAGYDGVYGTKDDLTNFDY